MYSRFKSIGLFLLINTLPAYAITLGQVTVVDSQQRSKIITYEEKGKFAVAEGDILIGKLDELHKKSAIFLPLIEGAHWPHGIVPYEIEEKLPFTNKVSVLQAIDYWQKHTSIKFVARTVNNKDDYPDYISFVKAEGTTCSSYVGKKGHMQEINLSTRCTTMNTVHEIGHALGLWHEQSRADRDSYVQINWDNIMVDHEYNFNQHLSDGNDYGEYDYESIMHYGPYAFSKNGQKTIVALVDGVEIGQRVKLSDKDLAAIKAMYPED